MGAEAFDTCFIRGGWLLAVEPVLGWGSVAGGRGVVTAIAETKLLEALSRVDLPRGNSLQQLLLAFAEGHSDVGHPLHDYLLQKGR